MSPGLVARGNKKNGGEGICSEWILAGTGAFMRTMRRSALLLSIRKDIWWISRMILSSGSHAAQMRRELPETAFEIISARTTNKCPTVLASPYTAEKINDLYSVLFKKIIRAAGKRLISIDPDETKDYTKNNHP